MTDQTLENPILTPIFDRIQQLVPCVHVSIYIVDHLDLSLVAYRGPVPAGRAALFSFPLQTAGGAHWVISNASRLIISDVKSDSAIARAFRRAAQEVPEETFDYIGSWIGVPLVISGEVVGMLDLAHQERGYYTDKDARRLESYLQQVSVNIENALLYAQLDQRSAESATLYAIQKAIGHQLETGSVLQLVAEEALRLTSAQQALMLLQQDGQLSAHALTDAHQLVATTAEQVRMLEPLVAMATEKGGPLRFYDTESDLRSRDQGLERAGMRSLLIVPLISRDQILGALVAVNKRFGAFGPADERVLDMLGSGAVVALENAKLYHAEQKRRRTTEAMQAVLISLSSNEPIDVVLQTAVRQACLHLGSQAGAVFLMAEEPDSVTLAATCRLSSPSGEQVLALVDPPMDAWSRGYAFVSQVDRSAKDGPPALLACLQQFDDDSTQIFSLFQELLASREQCQYALSVPLLVEKALVGVIELYYDAHPRIGDDERQLVEDIGRHVALALERHRYSEQVEHLARLEERQRIAVALHDSVVQNLFRVRLEARWCVAHGNLEPETSKRMETMSRLVNRSSYELRSAIFALRNRKLGIGHSLVELLQDQVNDFAERTQISTALVASPGLPALPVGIVEAIYRIVREALSNVARHASATAAAVNLRWDRDSLVLVVQDNGIGFEIEHGLASGDEDLHFGLDTMDRLATHLGGSFFIGRNDDLGTMVRVCIPTTIGEEL